MKWQNFYMKMAKLTSEMSKDPSTKVGAVIVRPDKTLCSIGFNGLPSRIPDYSKYLGDRNLKLQTILHAEENAILNSKDISLNDYAIYIYGLPPCLKCSSIIIQSKISKIYFCCEKIPERYLENYEETKKFCKVAEIRLQRYTL